VRCFRLAWSGAFRLWRRLRRIVLARAFAPSLRGGGRDERIEPGGECVHFRAQVVQLTDHRGRMLLTAALHHVALGVALQHNFRFFELKGGAFGAAFEAGARALLVRSTRRSGFKGRACGIAHFGSGDASRVRRGVRGGFRAADVC
jgi:hypothetical protein